MKRKKRTSKIPTNENDPKISKESQNMISDIEWGLHEELLARAEEMLDWPLSEKVVSEDGFTTIIKPCKWQLVDVVPIVDIAFRLATLSLGLTKAGTPDGDPFVSHKNGNKPVP
jgi:hypothetical protein